MKYYNSHIFLSFCSILLISCQPTSTLNNSLKDPDNYSCKNENWVWIKLKDGDSGWFEYNEASIPDGHYTFYYSNGNVREKGIRPFGSIGDEIIYFDTTGNAISKKVVQENSSVREEFFDGDFNFYTSTGQLLVSGKVSEGEFIIK